MHLSGALLLLESMDELSNHVLTVRPKGQGASLDAFGWACDGALVNAARGFALIGLALFIVGQWQHDVPTEALDLLSNIKVKYKTHASIQAHVVSNLVESALNSNANRSADDPVFLASELCRSSLGAASSVKAVLAVYKQRTLGVPSLQMNGSTEKCVLQLMQQYKVTPHTIALITDCVNQRSWQTCPFTAYSLLAPQFVVSAKLGCRMHAFMEQNMSQTAMGQCFAVERAISETGENQKIAQSEFDVLCGVCGCWCLFLQEKVLPLLGLGEC